MAVAEAVEIVLAADMLAELWSDVDAGRTITAAELAQRMREVRLLVMHGDLEVLSPALVRGVMSVAEALGHGDDEEQPPLAANEA